MHIDLLIYTETIAIWKNGAIGPAEVKIEIRNCNLGRGVFCTKPIVPEELVEFCPYIKTDTKKLVPPLNDYIFSLPDPDMFARAYQDEDSLKKYKKRAKPVMLMMGFGAMYNHSDHPNLYWDFFSKNPLTDDVQEQYIIFRAHRHIMPNQECTISYGAPYWDERPHIAKVDL